MTNLQNPSPHLLVLEKLKQLFYVNYVKIQVYFHIYFDSLIPKYKNYMSTILILTCVIIVLLLVTFDGCPIVNESNIRTMIHLENFNRKHLYKLVRNRAQLTSDANLEQTEVFDELNFGKYVHFFFEVKRVTLALHDHDRRHGLYKLDRRFPVLFGMYYRQENHQ